MTSILVGFAIVWGVVLLGALVLLTLDHLQERREMRVPDYVPEEWLGGDRQDTTDR